MVLKRPLEGRFDCEEVDELSGFGLGVILFSLKDWLALWVA